MRGAIRTLLAFVPAAALVGCTTLGSESVLRSPGGRVSSLVPAEWTTAKALDAYYAAGAGAPRRDIRDKVIGYYLTEEDARFREYKDAIRISLQQGNFLLDTFSIGLAAAASVAAKRTANTLSAGAAAVGGTRASFNKNVFFEQTIGALIAQMDAAHDRQATNIRLQMKGENSASYSLVDFFDDLARLESAGTIEKALQKTATDAGNKAADEQDRLEAAFISGPPDEDANTVRFELRDDLRQLLAKPAPGRGKQLAAAAGAIGVKVYDRDEDTVRSIRERFLPVTKGAEARELQSKFRKAIEDSQAALPAAVR